MAAAAAVTAAIAAATGQAQQNQTGQYTSREWVHVHRD